MFSQIFGKMESKIEWGLKLMKLSIKNSCFGKKEENLFIKEYLNNDQIKYKKFFNMNLMQKIRFFNSLKKIKENCGNLEIINYIDYDEAETKYEM